MLNCSKCGRQIRDEDAVYCPFCSGVVKPEAVKKTDFPIAGGILLIIGASVSILTGILVLIIVESGRYVYYYNPRPPYEGLIASGLSVLAFIYGVVGGVFSLKRRRFRHSLVGGLFVALEGLFVILALAQQFPSFAIIGVIFGLPVIALGGIGLLFLLASQEEFHK
ncbi:zinc ribbon domain-containing protein [Candidatus Bathyarchaeota archaeon]|nr:zinc ribbon domain-containing protein [Candidatus Bathyarchaeota archaeon]